MQVNKLPALVLVKESNGITFRKRSLELQDYGPGLGEFADITLREAIAFLAKEGIGHLYINPMWLVEANGECGVTEFLGAANWALVEWKKQLTRSLRPGPVRRMLKDMDLRDRTLAATGALFLNGAISHTRRIGRGDRRMD